jgi:ATP-dependent DNA helicase PIF1
LDDGDDEDPDDIEPDPEVEVPLADFEAYARRRPNHDLGQLDGLDGLGTRHIDRAYDWSPHVGKYSLDSEDWGRLRAENPIEQAVDVSPSAESLNLEQRKLYDIVVNQYIQELSDPALPQQLLLNVDGVAGSGKTYTLLKICAQLQDLALQARRQNPVFRAAPTGIAAYNIAGKTLHSLLRLPVRTQQADISASTLQALQLLFKNCRFLIIDEKSMIDLKTLSLIDDHLRAILPHNACNPFGGINVLLCGDFFQLPPVGGRALYSSVCTSPETIKGQQLYRNFDRTVRLVQVMRQQGEDDVSIRFRAALSELREGKLSKESWELFCTRVANQLSPDEVSTFDNALRLYFTKEEVYNRNIHCLTGRNMPVKVLTAVNRGRDAERATEDEADNLPNKIYMCIGARIMLSSNLWTEIGLVNGSMGTVVDITWQLGQDPTTSLPFAVLIQFDGYSGPVFPGCDAGIVPVFAELHRFDYRGIACTRLQFPLRLAYGITVHKSQGLTLSWAVLNLATKEHALSLSYVAVSQVKTL